MNTHKVYALVDERGCVRAMNSDAFLDDLTGWVEVDEGDGVRYHHAQGNYLDGPVSDESGAYRYKLEGGRVVPRTEEETAADVVPPAPAVSDAELALVELGGIVAEQQAAIVELAEMMTTRMERGDM